MLGIATVESEYRRPSSGFRQARVGLNSEYDAWLYAGLFFSEDPAAGLVIGRDGGRSPIDQACIFHVP